MPSGLMSAVRRLFAPESKRSANIQKNILLVVLLRFPDLFLKFLCLRLTLDYLEPLKYGVWITLASIVGWLSFSDFGIGLGLRNRLAESLSRNDLQGARTYISTTYAVTFVIASAIVVCFSIANNFINWAELINAPLEMADELGRLVFWMVFFSAYFLATGLIKVVLKASQIASGAAAVEFLTSLFSLFLILILLQLPSNSIVLLGFWHSFLLAGTAGFAGMYFFYIARRDLRPSWRYVDVVATRGIWSLGGKFLTIQLCYVVIFSTDSLLIARLLGPESVTSYMVVFQYFHVVTVGFATISLPFWSAYTDAYAKKDYVWIRRALKFKLFLLIPVAFSCLVMIGIGRFVIEDLWLGRDLGIDTLLLCLMAAYVVIFAWNRVFAWFLNGVGELKVTIYALISGALINIPISIFFVRALDLGSAGVILGTIASLGILTIAAPIKTYLLLRK